MNHYQTIRIVLLLLLIFVLGVWTGRFTAPKRHVIVNAAGRDLVETALNRMKSNVRITPEQEEKIRKIFQEMENEVRNHPPLSDERIEIFRRYTPRLKAELSPEQHAAFDRHVESVERRLETGQRRRGRN